MLADDRQQLLDRVAFWSLKLKVKPRVVRVQRMTQKWGSCSTTGVVSLASDLTSQSTDFQDFVIVHELMHLKVPRHGRLFDALMTANLPGWRRHDVARLAAKDHSSSSNPTKRTGRPK
jgi:predicted metal-dependent hydrolase